MAAFKDITSPKEIQNYLLDILSRMANNDEKYLYHYTSFESIAKIISSGVSVQSSHPSTSARAVPLRSERQASKEEMP